MLVDLNLFIMPYGLRRSARAKRLIRDFTAAQRSSQQRLLRRKARLQQALATAGAHDHPRSSDKEVSSSSSSSSSSMSLDTYSGGSLGSDEASASPMDQGSSEMEGMDLAGWQDDEVPLADLPDLPNLPDWGSDLASEMDESQSSGSLASDEDSDLVQELLGFDGDDEFSIVSDDDTRSDSDPDVDHVQKAYLSADHPHTPHVHLPKWDRLRHWVLNQLIMMYEAWYEAPRDGLPHGPSYLHHVLMRLKHERPDHFCEALRVNPTTFDALVAAIQDDPVFSNHSLHPQMPVEEQLAVTLYRFGHDGNASGLQSVANWAGIGKGTVSLVTHRVMTAILRPSFINTAVRWPTEDEKEDAKAYIEKHSCHAWRDGWCFVDGTLIPLADAPSWYSRSYYDRKNQYSLNFQASFSFFVVVVMDCI